MVTPHSTVPPHSTVSPHSTVTPHSMVTPRATHPEPTWRPGPKGWLLLIAAWTLLPLLILGLLLARGDVPTWLELVPHLVYWLAWAGMTPFLVSLCRRFPLSRRIAAHIVIHLVASAIVGVVLGGLLVVMQFVVMDGGLPRPVRFWEMASAGGVQFLFTALVYWLLLLLTRIVDGYRHLREREVLLAEARLAALKAQIRPHFLFNALNATSALIDEDPEAAQEMIARLGELLRASLESDGKAQEVTLGEEVALLRLYLDIEQVRFGDRLEVTIDVDAELNDACYRRCFSSPWSRTPSDTASAVTPPPAG